MPLLALIGGTSSRSYVELASDRLVARFGWLFHRSFNLTDVEGAGPRSWPWLYGSGWRSNLFGVIGLIGSRSGVVEIHFRQQRSLWMLLRFGRLAVSLEDPEAFLEALAKLGVPVSH